MLKEIKGSKNIVQDLLRSWTVIRLFSLCAALTLISSSALSLTRPKSGPDTTLQQQTVKNVTVTVRSTGCDPANVTEVAGQINLQVVNQTGQADLLVQFYDGRGNLVREVAIAQGASQWAETFDLKAGNYTIVAGRNQAWVCHLTIQ